MRDDRSKPILGAALGVLLIAGGAQAASVSVNFDLLPDGTPYVAQNTFAATPGPLRDEWAAEGVHFLGGGGVLTGNFGVFGYSGLNFLAFSSMSAYANGTSAGPMPPEQIQFDQPANLVQINVGSVTGGTAMLTAFDSNQNQVGSAQLALTSTVAPLMVQSSSFNIASVQLSVNRRSYVADDLVFIIQDHVDQPPVTQCALNGPAGLNGWFLGSVQATLTATDADGTVVSTRYQLDGGSWQPYSTPLQISGDGAHVLAFQSVDNDGNWELAKSTAVNIDTTSPVTQCTLNGPAGSNGRYLGDVQATLTATDTDDAVAATRWQLDGGDWQTYSGPVTISGNGPHTLGYQSQDSHGNWESPQSQAVTIDTTAPVTQCALSGPAGANGWFTGAVQATLTATDPDDAVVETQWRLDGGSWQPFTMAVSISGDGVHTLQFQSQDSSGNWETPQSQNIKIDSTTPVIHMSPTPSLLWAIHDRDRRKDVGEPDADADDLKPVTVNGSATDPVSGVGNVTFVVKDKYGKVQPALTSFGQTIQLQATIRPNDRLGRWYQVIATATSNAGQQTSASTWVRVMRYTHRNENRRK